MCIRRWVGLMLVAVPVSAFVFVPFKDAGREPIRLVVTDAKAPRVTVEDAQGRVYVLSNNKVTILPAKGGEQSFWAAPSETTLRALVPCRTGFLAVCAGDGGTLLMRLTVLPQEGLTHAWTRHFADLPAGCVHVPAQSAAAGTTPAIVGVLAEHRLYLLRDTDGEVLFDRPVGSLLCEPLWAEDSLFIAKDDVGAKGVTPAGRMVLGFELSEPTEAGIPLHFDWDLPAGDEPQALEWLPGSRHLVVHTDKQDYVF